MNLMNIKDCSKCVNAVQYGSKDAPDIYCNSDDYMCQELFNREGRYCACKCRGFSVGELSRGGRIEQHKALQFMLAGKCEFVLHSSKTNEDFKYEMTKKKSDSKEDSFIYFTSLIKGNEKIYAGVIWFNNDTQEFRFSTGKNGKVEPSNISIKSLIFVLNKLVKEETVQHLVVYHVGKCGKCGKKLTTPESILTGLGPTCSNKIGVPRVKINRHGDIIG